MPKAAGRRVHQIVGVRLDLFADDADDRTVVYEAIEFAMGAFGPPARQYRFILTALFGRLVTQPMHTESAIRYTDRFACQDGRFRDEEWKLEK